MRSTPDQYLRQQQALLPPGAAWSRSPGTIITAILEVFAETWARLHNRAADLLEEADPRTTLELLPDWERVTGLPDPCFGTEQTVQQRRAALVAQLTATGGQDRQYFIDLAARLGYEITIQEFRPFRAGSLAGDPCCDEPWWFVWYVKAPLDTYREFCAGISCAGEPIRTWGNEPLECTIRRYAPAHTLVKFSYGE
ncbi:putative phage tail protein [Ferrovibrio terrae]|uniref:YmfQ family protein n=1 Tax=Ferrovibrio terrae TaxID=2594003 RepID=UPI003137EF14